MDIKTMHLYFKDRLQKADSQQNRNFLIPQIDMILNHAQDVFIHRLAEPVRSKKTYGFEINQKIIDQLRTLVTSQTTSCQSVALVNDNKYVAAIPNDYMFYISSTVHCSTDVCQDIPVRLTIRQHDDKFESSQFDKSDLFWGIVNGTFYDNGIMIYTDGTFTPNTLCINYLHEPAYMHNAADFQTGTYTLPDGTVLTGTQDCELPEVAHNEIIDLAVMIAQGNLASPAIQYSQVKVNLSNN